MVRNLANKALIRISDGEFSTEVLNNLSKKLDIRDRAFLRELVYGVLENRTYLDYMIDKKSKIPTKKLEIDVLETLRVALYQLVFLDIEDYAIINEAVEVIKKTNKRSSAFVNGILRNINRDLENVKKINVNNRMEYLSIRYSHPIEIIKYLNQYFSMEEVEGILKENNEPSYNDIRVNSLQVTRDQIFERFEKENIKVEKSKISKDTIKLMSFENVTSRDDFKRGDYTIQGETSALVSEILNPKRGSSVLDICAAPGSKTCHLASIMENEGRVIANDVDRYRLNNIIENAARMNIDIIETVNFDGSILKEEYLSKFDYILCDVPCSGLGLLGKKPDIRWNFNINTINELSKLQRKIINNAYKYLKDDGKIVYSTCTYGRLENEDVIEDFLKNHHDMKLGDFSMKSFNPYKDKSDGFFIAELEKK